MEVFTARAFKVKSNIHFTSTNGREVVHQAPTRKAGEATTNDDEPIEVALGDTVLQSQNLMVNPGMSSRTNDVENVVVAPISTVEVSLEEEGMRTAEDGDAFYSCGTGEALSALQSPEDSAGAAAAAGTAIGRN